MFSGSGKPFCGFKFLENKKRIAWSSRASTDISQEYEFAQTRFHPSPSHILKKCDQSLLGSRCNSSKNIPENRILKYQGSAFKPVKKRNCSALHDYSSSNNDNSSSSSAALCYEILVNSLLKIFHHPNISPLPFNERIHIVVTHWPIIWLLQLGRKSTQPDTKIIYETLAKKSIETHLSPVLISSLLDLIHSLQSLSLDQAEFGLVETLVLTKLGVKGNIAYSG